MMAPVRRARSHDPMGPPPTFFQTASSAVARPRRELLKKALRHFKESVRRHLTLHFVGIGSLVCGEQIVCSPKESDPLGDSDTERV